MLSTKQLSKGLAEVCGHAKLEHISKCSALEPLLCGLRSYLAATSWLPRWSHSCLRTRPESKARHGVTVVLACSVFAENPAEQIKDLDIEAKLDLLKEDNTQATIIGNMFMKATDSFVGIASAAKLFKDKVRGFGCPRARIESVSPAP